MSLYTEQSANIRKTWLLMTVFLVIVITIGFVFAQVYNNPLIVYIAVVFSFVMNFVSFWYSDKVVLKISGAKPANREEHFDLYTIVENLSITAGIKMPRVYIIPDSAPNAFATGRNEKNAVVCVTTGLLSILDKQELEGVISHELSHIGNKDILVSTIVVVLVGFIALLSDFFIRFTFFHGSGRKQGGGQLGIIILLLGVVLAILSPIIATLIQLAISRKREFLADSSGALLTRYPKGLADALIKISTYSKPMERANNATAHLYISNPFGKKESKKFFHKIFSTHPPVEERVTALIGENRT